MVVTLGEDLETEILVRLPVKSLMRFKCVQRSWNALFRSPAFVTRHMHRQGSDERLMVFHDEIDSYYKGKFCIRMLVTGIQVQDFECPFTDKSLKHILSYGPSNGVFCLHGFFNGFYGDPHSQVILWNPATREVKVVPAPPPNPSPDQYQRGNPGGTRVQRGFGVDPNTNDFKVVNLLIDHPHPHPGTSGEEVSYMNTSHLHLVTSAEVYSLSTNSWTIIHDISIPAAGVSSPVSSTAAALANGVYHWLTGRRGYPDPEHDYSGILCFDFRNNQFRKLKAPVLIRAVLGGRDGIAELNDSLAYFVHDRDLHRLEIWIWNQDSWAKKYNIGPLDWMVHIYHIWKDGAQVLGGQLQQPLVSYNSDAQPVRHFQINVTGYCSIHKYVESIAPLSF